MISEETNFRTFCRDFSLGILVKKTSAFCLYLKSLSEAKMKIFVLIPLTEEEISKEPSI